MKRFLALLLVSLAAASCVTTPKGPTAPAVQTGDTRMPVIPELPPPDLSSLKGRVIAIDPGHGGPWPGAVSPSNGLREADVNLRVAKHLAGLIGDAGAQVVMTRTDDTVPVPDSTSGDLAARAELGNRARADAFISVHHNADVTGSGRNDLEVFYKMDDDGASLDLAQQLTYELARRLRVEAERKLLLPGNYKVLRESDVAAVLLESSYMTHPGNAAFLLTDPAVEAEARAIAAGLADYFRLDPLKLASTELTATGDGRTHALTARFDRGLPLDAGATRVTLEDRDLPGRAVVEGETLHWAFHDPLPNGTLRLRVRARNVRGLAGTFPVEARIDRPAVSVVVTQRPPTAWPDGLMQPMFEVRATDALGLAVADGTAVTLRENGMTANTSQGVARFYLASGSLPGTLTFACGDATARVTPRVGSSTRATLRIVDGRSGNPAGGSTVTGMGTVLGVATPEGWLDIPADAGEITVARAGYEPQRVGVSAAHTEVRLAPLYNGTLQGKRIALDAAFGGRSAGAIGPNGTRASDISLDVVRRAAAVLREAGAEVIATREGDRDLSEMQRVLKAEEAGAQILVSVSFGGPAETSRALDEKGMLRTDSTSFVGHYPNSPNGIRLAKALAGRLGIATVTPSVAYVVQQTGAPAVLVQPASIGGGPVEERYRDAAARQSAAEALAQAIVDYFMQSPP